MNRTGIRILFTVLVAFSLVSNQQVNGQSRQSNSRNATARQLYAIRAADLLTIDSLQSLVDSQRVVISNYNSMLTDEQNTSADLRDRLIKLDEYRKKLESSISSFKGENLQLNQSNRILIIFNSLVAVLLLVTLVFFLRRLGRKKHAAGNTDFTSPNTSINKSAVAPASSVEDKLNQLERLGSLREKGLLSEDEFNAEKFRILGK